MAILDPKSEHESREDLDNVFLCIVNKLLGRSEYYACRVFESCVVTYSPVDIIPEIVNLD
jgi:hypothetical protein